MGFVPALLYLRDQFDGPVAVRLDIDHLTDETESSQALPEFLVLTAYRIVEEALSNTVKHADATWVTVRARLHGNSNLLLTIEDDGVGPTAEASQRHGLGMAAMHDLVEALGGTVRLEERVDGGARVTASIPVAHDWHGQVPPGPT